MTAQEMGVLWWIGLGVVHAIVWAGLYDRLYLRTPAAYWGTGDWGNSDVRFSPGPFLALAYFIGLGIATGLVVTLPVAATLGAMWGLNVTAWWGRFPAAAVFLLGLPGLVAGMTMIRRAVWLWRLKGQIERLPTSTVRGAALGLVELKGRAVAAPGEGPTLPSLPSDRPPSEALLFRLGARYGTAAFYLEDGTGRVRVEPPPGHARGEDERMVLTKRADFRGSMAKAHLLPGDPVYVLGNLETIPGAPEDERHVVRPLRTSYARLLDTEVMGAMPVAGFLATFLGLGFVQHADFFLLTDAEEGEAKRRFCRQWRRTLAWGLVWCAVSMPLAYWGLRGVVEPGVSGLLRAITSR
jgi:hypothetical protein